MRSIIINFINVIKGLEFNVIRILAVTIGLNYIF